MSNPWEAKLQAQRAEELREINESFGLGEAEVDQYVNELPYSTIPGPYDLRVFLEFLEQRGWKRPGGDA